jgi:hypothetical protein
VAAVALFGAMALWAISQGGGARPDRSLSRSTVSPTSPSRHPPSKGVTFMQLNPDLAVVLAGVATHTLTRIDFSRRTVEDQEISGLIPGDPPYFIAARDQGRFLVSWGSQDSSVLPATLDGAPRSIGPATYFVPSAAGARVWLIELRGSLAFGRPSAREVAVVGTTVPIRYGLPGDTGPLAAVTSGLVLRDPGGGLDLWYPESAGLERRVGRDQFVASGGTVLASCDQDCSAIDLFDTVGGEHRLLLPPVGSSGFVPPGALSPNGSLLAVPVIDENRGSSSLSMATCSIADGVCHALAGAQVPGPDRAAPDRAALLIAWSADGRWMVFTRPRGGATEIVTVPVGGSARPAAVVSGPVDDLAVVQP